MRSRIELALAALVLLATSAIQGQGKSVSADTITRVLDRRTRVDLLNSVLRDRSEQFHQPAIIQRCYAARMLGPADDPLAGIQLNDGMRFSGTIGGECERTPSEPVRGDTVSIAFQRIDYEASEYIPMDRLGPRVPGLMVVRLTVLNGGAEDHMEEWVMRKAGEGIWAVMTVRMFAFWVV